MPTRTREITYKNLGQCVEISNGVIDLVATVSCGPRVIRYGFVGSANMLCENDTFIVPVDSDCWKFRGGHRLWHSPEVFPRTYIPDNDPVEWKKIDNGITLLQPVEPSTQIQKEMTIQVNEKGSKVTIIHSLTNKNSWDIQLAVWALTAMAPGGREILPQPSRENGYLPNRVLSLWPYSKMNDRRIAWGDRYIFLRQDPERKDPFKLGFANEDGWAAYFNLGNLFIKRYEHIVGAEYPDFGVSYETYTNDFMLEMESLSPLKVLRPGETIRHSEKWELIPGVEAPSEDEQSIDKIVKMHIL